LHIAVEISLCNHEKIAAFYTFGKQGKAALELPPYFRKLPGFAILDTAIGFRHNPNTTCYGLRCQALCIGLHISNSKVDLEEKRLLGATTSHLGTAYETASGQHFC